MNYQVPDPLIKTTFKPVRFIERNLLLFYFRLLIEKVENKQEFKYYITIRLFWRTWKLIVVSSYLSEIMIAEEPPTKKLKNLWTDVKKGFSNG